MKMNSKFFYSKKIIRSLILLIIFVAFFVTSGTAWWFNDKNQSTDERSVLASDYIQEWGATHKKTNIVAVVDCSSSMQTSDSQWRVPESLQLLADMCDDEDIRMSLIVYGTEVFTKFRDIPLTEENHSMIRKNIQKAIQGVGYTLGQTDTGAALTEARKILEEQEGQNNIVLLFTDGVIMVDHRGRTEEISTQEVDAFAAYAQNHGITVNTLGLFGTAVDKAIVEKAEEELSILRSKTGGIYQRITDASDIPDFVISMLAGILDVKNVSVSEPTVSTIEEKKGWSYQFHIPDVYIDDLTILIPTPEKKVQDVLISGPSTNGETISVNGWTGGSWYAYWRYNGTAGYNIIRLKRGSEENWTGDYTVTIVTNQKTAPDTKVFYLYAVDVHVQLRENTTAVMQSIPVEVYLTDQHGYRIDNLEFLQTLTVEMNVINQGNHGVEVSATGVGEEIVTENEYYTQKLQLGSDSFRINFIPQYASEYAIQLKVFNDYFSRNIETVNLSVTDQLEIVSSVVTTTPQKNDAVEIRAYLQQSSDHSKVVGNEYYRLSGASVLLYNTETGMTETVKMEALENGNGLAAVFYPKDAGVYEAAVSTSNQRETVERKGEVMSFEIIDRPVSVRTWQERFAGSSLLESLVRKYRTGNPITVDGKSLFYDADGDSYRLVAEVESGVGKQSIFDNVFTFIPEGKQTLTVTLKALDYSGNSAETTISFRVLSVFEVICMNLLLVFLGGLLVFFVVYAIRYSHNRKNQLKGIMRMEVSIWGEEDGKRKEIPTGRFYVRLDNRAYEHLDKQEQLLPPMSFFRKMLPEKIDVARLLKTYARCYASGGPGQNSIYKYFINNADYSIKCYLTGDSKGKKFSLKGVKRGKVSEEEAFTMDKSLRQLDHCVISIPIVDTDSNNNLYNGLDSINNIATIRGLVISLKYYAN